MVTRIYELVTFGLTAASHLFMTQCMSDLSIFNYTDAKEFILHVIDQKKKHNKNFSLRAWAKEIGLRNHSLLSLVLNNKRKLKPELATKIRTTLNFSDEEKKYYDILVLFENARTGEEKEFYSNVLASVRPQKSFVTLQLDVFRLISDWYHFAVLEMLNLKDFNYDPRWIAERLGNKVSSVEIQLAIERLKRLKFIEYVGGELVPCEANRTTTKDIPSEAIKNFHCQVLKKAAEALKEQDVSERNFTSNTICIDKAKITKAKKMIREFENRLIDFLEVNNGNEVYQFNTQLFKLTEGKG